MKNLLILCFGLITTTVFGQFENHSFSISYDQGPGIGFVRDYSTTFQKQFGIVNKKNIGATVGYAYFHNFAKHAALSFGLDLSFMSFPQNITFTNVPKGVNQNPGTYDFGWSRNYFLNIDLPFLFYYHIPLKGKNAISPIIGLKIRNIAYIGDEERNTTVSSGYRYIDENGNTTFEIDYELDYNAYMSRVVFNPVLGFEYSRILKDGKSLTLFANYNYGLINGVEFRYVGLGNVENGESYAELEDRKQRFRVKMSHFRVGLAFRWSKKSETKS